MKDKKPFNLKILKILKFLSIIGAILILVSLIGTSKSYWLIIGFILICPYIILYFAKSTKEKVKIYKREINSCIAIK